MIKLNAQVGSFGNDYFGPSGTYLFRSDSINSSTSDLGPITQRRFSRRNPLMVDVGSINNNNYSTSSILDNYHFGNHNAGGFSSHIYGENANDIAIHPSNGLPFNAYVFDNNNGNLIIYDPSNNILVDEKSLLENESFLYVGSNDGSWMAKFTSNNNLTLQKVVKFNNSVITTGIVDG